MSKIIELKQQSAAKVTAQRKILDKAEEENRDLTADEQSKYEQIEADFTSLQNRIKRLEEADSKKEFMDKTPDQAGGLHLIDGIGDPSARPLASKEYKNAFFNGYARKGRNGLEHAPKMLNALETGVDSEGGYLVPEEWAAELMRLMADVSVVRGLASTITTASDRNIPVSTARATFGWHDEEAPTPEGQPVFGNVVIGAHKGGGIIKVSEELLQDSAYDIAGTLSADAADEFNEMEESAFLTGDGVGKPTGLFNTTAVAGQSVTGYQGAASAAPVVTFEDTIETYYSLKKGYRSNASWILGDGIEKMMRKIKDSDGQYIWQPSVALDKPNTLHGRPIANSDFAPAPAVNAKSIIFGDISYYRIVDRLSRVMQRLNELYAENGQIGFRFIKRLDGKLTRADAITFFQHGAAS